MNPKDDTSYTGCSHRKTQAIPVVLTGRQAIPVVLTGRQAILVVLTGRQAIPVVLTGRQAIPVVLTGRHRLYRLYSQDDKLYRLYSQDDKLKRLYPQDDKLYRLYSQYGAQQRRTLTSSLSIVTSWGLDPTTLTSAGTPYGCRHTSVKAVGRTRNARVRPWVSVSVHLQESIT